MFVHYRRGPRIKVNRNITEEQRRTPSHVRTPGRVDVYGEGNAGDKRRTICLSITRSLKCVNDAAWLMGSCNVLLSAKITQ